MPLDPRRQIKAVSALLERLYGRGFYGEVIIRMEGGNILYSRVTEIKRIEDLAAEAETRPIAP